jgi:hypothetical protein
MTRGTPSSCARSATEGTSRETKSNAAMTARRARFKNFNFTDFYSLQTRRVRRAARGRKRFFFFKLLNRINASEQQIRLLPERGTQQVSTVG